MGDVLAVVQNEWMKLKHRRRLLVVLAIAILMLCALTGITYIDAKRSEEWRNPLNQLKNQIEMYEADLRNFDSASVTEGGRMHGGSKEELEAQLTNVKKEYERAKEFATGDWKAVLQEEKKEAEAIIKDPNVSKEEKSYKIEELERINYHLENDVKPLRGLGTSGYNELQNMNGALVMLFVPFLVIFLVADMVSSESSSGTIKLLLIRPISRFKILLGKWIVSILATILFSVVFYTLLWVMLSIIFGFTTGMYEPQWLNVVTETISRVDEFGKSSMQTIQHYDNAYLIPSWLYLIYLIGMSTVAMILIATIAFFCTTIFKTVIMSTGVAFVVVVVGMVLNMVIQAPSNKLWLFTNHLDLMQHWSGTTVQASLTTGFMVLGIWLVVAIVPTFYVFTKRDVFNA
ncbi:ABC transporter permease [Priestia taiwanensis]|uniref:ABC transporter permease n=1 Tax=Priestia taiwanensis TaxID=1347902 RepID=A0A917ARR0_9BACI|nr:ABC transporter permease [Priestia taiwanensis]MBM7363897.1 ABC-2 type transport system permease protein [Priestia taiwanensis]GGE69926.1 ABC transporter permease [Priestia taiwanensis]